jgi:hypothetical protein
MKRTILTAIVLGCAFSAVTSFAAETKSGSGGANAWSVKAPLPRTNSEFGVAELDGKIYVMGGYPADRKSPSLRFEDGQMADRRAVAASA